MIKKMFFAALIIISLPSLFASDWADIVKRCSSSVCKIEIVSSGQSLSSGSGFLIDAKGRIFTNAHVVADAAYDPAVSIEVLFPQSVAPDKRYKATLETMSDTVDLAIIDIDAPPLAALSLRKGDKPQLMAEILILGYPLGQSLKGTPGYIQAFQNVPGLGSMLDLSAAVDPGNSGGPVLDKEGMVVGIVTAKIPGYNFNLALPIQTISGFLENAKTPGEVEIASVPNDALVFCEGFYIGKTPLKLKMYGFDRKLSVECDGFEAMEKTVTAEMIGKAPLQFVLAPAASRKVAVTVESEPAGAKIWINNSELGKAPVLYRADRNERLRIRATLFGYRELNVVETVGSDDAQNIKIRMKR
jgi:hypothetical protein